jgi:ParB-like chromosome segregation protein Spo0J
VRIETLRLSDIEPAGYNPRVQLKPTDPEWKRLEAALDEYGLVEPLVYNERTKRLVGGHQRLSILKHRGVEEAEFSVVDLDEDREKALNIALNNPNLQSKWDPHKLVAAAETMDAHTLRLAGFDSMDDTHEIMRRYELMREGSFLSEFLAPPPEGLPAGYENPADVPDGGKPPSPRTDKDEDDEDDEPEKQETKRAVETDLKEPHKHLAGEQYFEEKLIFDQGQREIWLRFVDRIKTEKDTGNTFEALIAHASDFNAEWDRRHIEQGVDTL